jgi:hypothetical protein
MTQTGDLKTVFFLPVKRTILTRKGWRRGAGEGLLRITGSSGGGEK